MCWFLTLLCSFLFSSQIIAEQITLQEIVNECRECENSGQYDKALELYFEGLAINPDIIDVQFGKDIGNWTPASNMRIGTLLLPPDKILKYREDVRGKTVLVYHQKGHGDTIQFARFLTAFIEEYQPAKVLFVPQKALVDIMRNSQSLLGSCLEIIDPSIDLESLTYDRHVGLLALPALVDANATNLPHRDAYLLTHSRPFDQAYGKAGIFWQGDPSHIHDKDRSVSLQKFSPLKDLAGWHFYALQTGYGREQLDDPLNGWNGELVDLGKECRSFADIAECMAAMDIIITIDTAAAHLATALGKKTYILLPRHPDLRWAGDSPASFWSNSAILMRQQEAGNWDELIERLKGCL